MSFWLSSSHFVVPFAVAVAVAIAIAIVVPDRQSEFIGNNVFDLTIDLIIDLNFELIF